MSGATTPTALPVFGTTRDKQFALGTGALSLLITAVYVLIASLFGTTTTLIEGASLWASLACVWLARSENIWTMPYGIFAVLLLGWYLLDIDLVAQGWLQYLFYVPVQIIGWRLWCRGGINQTELQVSRLVGMSWALTVISALTCWGLCWVLFGAIYDSPAWLPWDSSIVASSIVAQSLMTWKKREAWWFWTLPVNVSSIGLFVMTESYAFVFLYVVFLANSILGWLEWHRAEKRLTS